MGPSPSSESPRTSGELKKIKGTLRKIDGSAKIIETKWNGETPRAKLRTMTMSEQLRSTTFWTASDIPAAEQ